MNILPYQCYRSNFSKRVPPSDESYSPRRSTRRESVDYANEQITPDSPALRRATVLRIGSPGLDDATPFTDRNKKKKKKVLVVDDNPMVRSLLKTMIEKMGHECHCAIDGRQAIAEAQKQRFNAIVIDMHMPMMSMYRKGS